MSRRCRMIGPALGLALALSAGPAAAQEGLPGSGSAPWPGSTPGAAAPGPIGPAQIENRLRALEREELRLEFERRAAERLRYDDPRSGQPPVRQRSAERELRALESQRRALQQRLWRLEQAAPPERREPAAAEGIRRLDPPPPVGPVDPGADWDSANERTRQYINDLLQSYETRERAAEAQPEPPPAPPEQADDAHPNHRPAQQYGPEAVPFGNILAPFIL